MERRLLERGGGHREGTREREMDLYDSSVINLTRPGTQCCCPCSLAAAGLNSDNVISIGVGGTLNVKQDHLRILFKLSQQQKKTQQQQHTRTHALAHAPAHEDTYISCTLCPRCL